MAHRRQGVGVDEMEQRPESFRPHVTYRDDDDDSVRVVCCLRRRTGAVELRLEHRRPRGEDDPVSCECLPIHIERHVGAFLGHEQVADVQVQVALGHPAADLRRATGRRRRRRERRPGDARHDARDGDRVVAEVRRGRRLQLAPSHEPRHAVAGAPPPFVAAGRDRVGVRVHAAAAAGGVVEHRRRVLRLERRQPRGAVD